jgi:hypothetical protein
LRLAALCSLSSLRLNPQSEIRNIGGILPDAPVDFDYAFVPHADY